VALKFLLAASQGCLVGLNFVEASANFSRFLSGNAAMLACVREDSCSVTRRQLVATLRPRPYGEAVERARKDGPVQTSEEQRFNLRQVTHLRLTLVPNKRGSGTASLAALRLFAWTGGPRGEPLARSLIAGRLKPSTISRD
jgi:hypothetical protein